MHIYWSGAGVTLYQGDFREATIEPNSVRLVHVDPPYYKKFEDMYPACTKLAGQVLQPGGDLLCILPHWAIPQVGSWTENTGLQWRWLINMDQRQGSYARLVNGHRNIAVSWKPIGWWYKHGGPLDYAGVIDSFENVPPKKEFHEWEQSSTWADYGVLNFSQPGDLVLDPMVGTGTTLASCITHGRRGIGIDNDERMLEACVTRLERLAEETL